jgi:hypothetical protein
VGIKRKPPVHEFFETGVCREKIGGCHKNEGIRFDECLQDHREIILLWTLVEETGITGLARPDIHLREADELEAMRLRDVAANLLCY